MEEKNEIAFLQKNRWYKNEMNDKNHKFNLEMSFGCSPSTFTEQIRNMLQVLWIVDT